MKLMILLIMITVIIYEREKYVIVVLKEGKLSLSSKLHSKSSDLKIQKLRQKLEKKNKEKTVHSFLKTDKKVRIYTGLPHKRAFQSLLNHVSSKANKIRYWYGSKKVISTKYPRRFKKTPEKSGPKRKLTIEEELVLVLLKVRLAVNNTLLSDLFSISLSTTSHIFNTWIKFLCS